MLATIWNGFLDFLANNRQKFPLLASLLKQLRPQELTEKKIVLGCENQGIKFFLEKKIPTIEKALLAHLKKRLKVEFVIIPKKKSKKNAPLLNFQPSIDDVYHRANLSKKFNFKNFAVSSTNQVAYAASMAVSENPGKSYNPLFLYGGVGVGKTHLAQAIGKVVLEKNKEKRVFFCPGDQFTNELIESIRNKTTPAFRRKYRKLSVLIVDDIQFIAGKRTIQEEFFHTFNSVISAGGQIILTSDRHPSAIKNLEDRLRSRFSGGLIVDIQNPDFELRTAITLIKAKEKNIDIDINAARVIAEQVSDTRALEGMLLTIYAKSLDNNQQINLEAIDEYFSSRKTERVKKITPDGIIKTICSYYNVKKSYLKGPKRTSEISLARQIAMYILRNELNLKLEQIAYILKRKDHTTIIHGVDKITRLTTENPAFKTEIRQIINSVSL